MTDYVSPSDVSASYDDARISTYDFLKPNAFRFLVNDLPQVSYNCQAVSLPGVSFGAARMATPFHDFSLAGEKVDFGDLTIRFIVSENMENYIELFNWMLGMGNPYDYEKYKEWLTTRRKNFPGLSVDNPRAEVLKYSNASLLIMTSANNPAINITFDRVFPTDLSGLEFDTTVNDINFFTCNATFKFQTFAIQSV